MKLYSLAQKLVLSLFAGAAVLFSACSPQGSVEKDQMSIVVTSYPEYDWLCQILGSQKDQYHITLLMDKGGDMHSYQPTIKDIASIADADLFIYNGGASYAWVDKILKQDAKADRKVVNLMEGLGDRVLMTEATCCHHDHATCEHDHATCEHDHAHDALQADEHIWLSLRNAITLCGVIEDAVSTTIPEHADQFEANKQAYIAKLKARDRQFAEYVGTAARDSVVLVDRFPFLYLMNDYGIKCHAAFPACSAETEASFETVAELTDLLKELNPPVILILEGGMRKLAETILKNSGRANCKIMELNAMHNSSPQSKEAGEDYASMMEQNLKTLEAALAQ